jgi:hypothetical protein
MNRRKSKTLKLSRETLRGISGDELQGAAGARKSYLNRCEVVQDSGGSGCVEGQICNTDPMICETRITCAPTCGCMPGITLLCGVMG